MSLTYLPRAAAAATAVAALLALATGCSGAEAPAAAKDAAPAAAPVSLPAPRSAPAPAAVLTPAPAAGEVRTEQGPFTDRVKLTDLKLTGTPSVTGHIAISSDVSDTLALEITAAYYDAQGRLLGTGTFRYQEEGEDSHAQEHHDGPRAAGDGVDFTVPADHLTGTPASAVLTIPVLVNE
ncbi:hypothetical protein ABZ766_23335 [Streptomyces sp. NPDC006670]|uniref:hypothetical protein n=1 Tax=Streptomyces sp. NPDC006670 TaxID=3154476 RepID=UPI0034072EC3